MTALIKKEISILPDRSLMPKIGQTGYSVSQAISELIDNAIDARTNEELVVDVILDKDKDLIKVSDNGIGMDEQTAANSMKLAYSAKIGKLGEFGLGMKTAATCLGKKFRVITKKENSKEEYLINYDEEKWLKEGDWNKHEMEIREDNNLKKKGTSIEITGLTFKIYPNLPNNIKKELAIRFAPFIQNGEVTLKVNHKYCEPTPLELKTDYHLPDGKEPFRFKLESGNEVYGWRGLLKKGSDKGDYGFRVFRRGRLVLQFAKIGFNAHPEARQIVGDLHLDHVPVTHNKREFIQESPLFQELNNEGGFFWNFMREIVREARSSIRKTQISQGIIDKMDIVKENIMKAIKKLPELKEYAFPDIKEKIKGSNEDNSGFDRIEIEKRDEREIVTVEIHNPPINEQDRKPRKTHEKKIYFVTIHGKKFKVNHDFVDLKTEDVIKDKVVSEEKGIQVFTNIQFPAFSVTTDSVFYATWNIAEAIAEVMVEQNNRPTEEIFKIRDLILKKSSSITRELDEVEKDKKIAEKLKKDYEQKIEKIKNVEKNYSE